MVGVLIACAWCAVFLFVVRRWRFFHDTGLDTRWIAALFLLKVAAGTALWAVYTWHYPDRSTADIFKYFDDGNVLFSALPAHPGDYLRMVLGIGNDTPYFDAHYYTRMNTWYRQWDTGYYNDAHTMIRFSALVQLFSFGHYHVHTVFACFASLVGLTAMYKAFHSVMPGRNGALFAAVLLWPSVMFWGSAPIKEALLFLGLGLFLLGSMRLLHGSRRWTTGLAIAAGLFLQLILKSYVLMCLLPALAAYAWCLHAGARRPLLKFAVVYGAVVLLGMALPLLDPAWDAIGMIAQKRRDMLGVVALTDPGSYVPITPLGKDIVGFLMDVPHALYLTFISPFLTWDIGAMGLLGAAENALLLALLPVALRLAKPWSAIDVPLLLMCLGFCLALGVLVGWTTPVVGALLRYRVPLLPFWAVAALLVIDPEKLPKWRFIHAR